MPLYLTEDEVGELLSIEDALEAVEASFHRLVAGEVALQPRLRLPVEDGAFALMGAVDRGLGYAGVKSYVWLPGGTPFVVCLFSLEHARLEAVLEADKLGQLRTGAASGVAARYLARLGARTLGVLGCGWQAESQVAAIRAAVPSIEEVIAFCRTPENLKAFCKKTGAQPAESHKEAGEQDVVVTATTSKDPVLRGDWLKPGALVCAVGANDPARARARQRGARARELRLLRLARAGASESGDLIEPVEHGVLDWLEVHELQEVVAGGDRRARIGRRHRRLQVERDRGVGRRRRRARGRAGA